MQFVEVTEQNIADAGCIHSESWKESHRSFCSAEFVEKHTPIAQAEYLRREMNAGKSVFCEKSMAFTLDEALEVYNRRKELGSVLFIGQQRLFDPKYVKAMSMIHEGVIGEVVGVRNYWYRNNNWRREVPSPELERHINWRL